MAEETGLIVPLGEWVLRTACQHLHTWQTAAAVGHDRRDEHGAPLFVSVNLSPKQLEHADLCDTVRQILDETGTTPGQLTWKLRKAPS